VVNTLQAVGFKTLPYHTHVPSFGDWGFVMATLEPNFKLGQEFMPELKFLNKATFEQMCVFPKDMPGKKTEVNKLNNQVLVHYFEEEWAQYLN
jgi:spermidine synthase